jgi:hypothetical protein
MTYYMTTTDIIAVLQGSVESSPDETRALLCAALCDAGYHGLAHALREAASGDTSRCMRVDDELLDELRTMVVRRMRESRTAGVPR